jgi:hypothetical protein
MLQGRGGEAYPWLVSDGVLHGSLFSANPAPLKPGQALFICLNARFWTRNGHA